MHILATKLSKTTLILLLGGALAACSAPEETETASVADTPAFNTT